MIGHQGNNGEERTDISNGVEIIPAIMPESLDDLHSKASMVKGLVKTVQLDVMDGEFVPAQSWPYVAGGPQEFAEMANGHEGLPLWQEVNWEADLMVARPEEIVDDWVRAGVRRIIVHLESVKDFSSVVETIAAQQKEDVDFGVHVELGIAINPGTQNSTLYPLFDRIDFVQFMGIDRIGFQGEKFNEAVLVKIRDLRKQHPEAIISVDGGVNFENAPQLIAAGANRLVSGSALFGSGNVAEAIKELQGAA